MPDSPRLPGNDRHLSRLVTKKAKSEAILERRIRLKLNAMIITAILDRVRDENEEPIFLLKGGVAIELRLKLRARTTSDCDLAYRIRSEEIFDLIDEAIRDPWNGFQVTRGVPETREGTAFQRVDMKLSYKGALMGNPPS